MLPPETIVALFPSPTRAGKTTIGPMTLAHACALEAVGIDVIERDYHGRAMVAAWILSMPPAEATRFVCSVGEDRSSDIVAWVGKSGCDEDSAAAAVDEATSVATSTYIPGKRDEVSLMPKGLGWPLELAELMCAEYTLGFDDAMAMPLARVLAFAACVRARNGGEHGGPDYWERIQFRQIREAKERMKAERARAEASVDAKKED